MCASPHEFFSNILVIYNSPSACTFIFYKDLAELFKSFKSNNEVLLLGDFNINWMENRCNKELKNLTSKFDFQQLIKGPTRVTRSIESMIDLIFSNKPDRITKAYNLI